MLDNKKHNYPRSGALLWVIILLYPLFSEAQQASNYVANGSFEEYYTCDGQISSAKSWLSIDSMSFGGLYYNACSADIPGNGVDYYQYPRTGNGFIRNTFYLHNGLRGYLKNRLKSTLQAGKKYCARFYVNITNGSTYAIDGFGAYFGDNTIDTITRCTKPLTYLTPQIKNPNFNFITDTMNWVSVTGTFVANGIEKYMVIEISIPMI